LAVKRLKEMGYENVLLMKEGLSQWKKRGYSVEKGSGWFPF
jgi:rhodanese-related sulfurtransferase